MKKELIYIIAGALLGYAFASFKKKRRGRVIVNRIDTITKDQFNRGRIGQFPDLN